MDPITSLQLRELFLAELYQMYWFENAWITMLGRLGRSTCLPQLGSALKKERAYSQEHVSRLRQIFRSIGGQPDSRECQTLTGLITDLENASACMDDNNMACDLSFILAVLKASHYQISTYNGMLQLAGALHFQEASGLIKDTLEEEKQTIQDLTALLSIHTSNL